MPVQDFDFSTGKVLDPKRFQAVVAVEDATDVAVLQKALLLKKYKFLGQVNDLRAALESVKEHKVGVLFLDADMAGNVNELLPSLQKAYPCFNVVVISGNATKESLTQAMEKGAAGFLVKPVQSDSVVKVLERIK